MAEVDNLRAQIGLLSLVSESMSIGFLKFLIVNFLVRLDHSIHGFNIYTKVSFHAAQGFVIGPKTLILFKAAEAVNTNAHELPVQI